MWHPPLPPSLSSPALVPTPGVLTVCEIVRSMRVLAGRRGPHVPRGLQQHGDGRRKRLPLGEGVREGVLCWLGPGPARHLISA